MVECSRRYTPHAIIFGIALIVVMAVEIGTDKAWAEVLRAEGYVPPKWWQVSRWGEVKPPKEVLAVLSGNLGVN